MSSMEYNKGTLFPTNIDTELFDEDTFDVYRENGYVVIHRDIYSVAWEYKATDLEEGFNRTVVDANGTIHFETYHYNGGAHWTELVEERV